MEEKKPLKRKCVEVSMKVEVPCQWICASFIVEDWPVF
jgi:hypothetical protein